MNTNTCERTDELLGFLYGELSDLEARRFERHKRECAICEADYASFSDMRKSLVAWRDESLPVGSSTIKDSVSSPVVLARPSAFEAIRSFFSLSPLWMKGAAALASVLFCVCAVLAIAYVKLDRRPQNPSVVDITETPEFKEKLAQAVKELKQDQGTGTSVVAGREPRSFVPRKQVTTSKSTTFGFATGRSRRPLTRQERMELAADLRLLRDDDDFEIGVEPDTNNHPDR